MNAAEAGIVMSSVQHVYDAEKKNILTINGLLDDSAEVNLLYDTTVGVNEIIAYSSNVNYLTDYNGKLIVKPGMTTGCHMVTKDNYIVLSDMYQVTFDFCGGKNGTASYEVKYNTALRDAVKAPVREGYEFKGYYAEDSYVNMYYTEAGVLADDGKVFTEQDNITLYAKWDQILEWKETPESVMVATTELETLQE